MQFAFLLLPLTATASEGAAHEPGLGMFWFNFTVYVLLMVFILRKPFSGIWGQRSKEIESAIAGAGEELKQADSRLISSRDKLVAIDREIAKLRQEMEAEAQTEISSIKTGAQSRIALIRHKAEEMCRIEEKSAEDGIRNDIGELALRRAQEMLLQRMTAEKDKSLRETALRKVSGLVQ